MNTETLDFWGFQGQRLFATLWLPDGEPRGGGRLSTEWQSILDATRHWLRRSPGMALQWLGSTFGAMVEIPEIQRLPPLGKTDGKARFRICTFFRLLSERFPGRTHFLLGFSLGSFLLREYLGRYPKGVAGAAILGTGYQPGVVLSVMMAIVKNQIKKAGFDGTTDLVKQLSFGNYNQKFKPNRTTADWLCADCTQLDTYFADPLCRKTISAGLFWQLLGSMKRTGSRDAYRGWNKDTPILLISGRDDPVGDSGKGVVAVKKRMEKAGIRRVTLELLPNARHDLLHEEATAAADARNILLRWMEDIIAPSKPT